MMGEFIFDEINMLPSSGSAVVKAVIFSVYTLRVTVALVGLWFDTW